VFGRDNPKILEIGCGMGETTAKIAEANPHNDYFGLEVHVPGVGALCKLIAEKNLPTCASATTTPSRSCATCCRKARCPASTSSSPIRGTRRGTRSAG
jgi:hypothetical protein